MSDRKSKRALVNRVAGGVAVPLLLLLVDDKFHGLDIDGWWLVTTVALLCLALLVTVVTWEPVALRQPLAWKGWGIRTPAATGARWRPRTDLELLGRIHRAGIEFRDDRRADLAESWRENLIRVVRAAYGEAQGAVFVHTLPAEEHRADDRLKWLDAHLAPLAIFINRAGALPVQSDFKAEDWIEF